MNRSLFKIILAFNMLLCTGILYAQIQTGSIEGRILDENGEPLAGASVVLSGPALMRAMTYYSTENGDYRFMAVPPGSKYSLHAELVGFKSEERTDIFINVGKTTKIDLKLSLMTIDEEISIMAPAPLVDVKNAKMSVNISEGILQNIPLERDFYAIITSSPGVISHENELLRTFSTHGGTVRSNKVALEGVTVTDHMIGVNFSNLSFDVFEEIEIEAGGHPPTVGMADGAYVNIVTRSGGNKFSGQGNILFFNRGMVESLISEVDAEAVGLTAPSGHKKFVDYSLSFGGPFLKDRLWFFLNGRYMNYETSQETLPDGLFDLKHRELLAFAKLTFQLSKNIKIVGMWNYGNYYEPVEVISPFSYDWDPYYREKSSRPQINTANHHSVLGKALWILDQNTYFDVRFNLFKNCIPIYFQTGIDHALPTIIDLFNESWSGSPRFNEEYLINKFLFTVNATHFLDQLFGGNHEVKAGIEYEYGMVNWDRWKENPYSLTTYNNQPWGYLNIMPFLGYFSAISVGFEKGDMISKNRLRRFSAYLQDNWTLKNRLTFNIGIRYDESHGDVLGGQYHLAGSDDPVLTLLAPHFFRDIATDDQKNVIVWRDFSPRIGVVYDVFNDAKTSLKISWSRYNEYLINQYFSVMNSMYPQSLQVFWMDLDGDGEIETDDMFMPVYMPTDPEQFELEENLDPNIKAPYMNEFIIGIERELFKDFKLSISYIRKSKKRIVEDVDIARGYSSDSRWWVPYSVNEPGQDGEYGTSDDKHITVYGVVAGAPSSQWWFTNPDSAERKYQAVEFVFDKRMSNKWQLTGSLTLSKFEGNIDADFMATWGYSSAFDSPNWNVNRYGRLWFDRPLVIKLQGTVILPYDIVLSGYYFYGSGAPFIRTLQIQLPWDPTYLFPGTLVEVNADSPGDQRLSSHNNLDLRLEKKFRFSQMGFIGIFLDILNVFGDYSYDIYRDSGGTVYADGSFEHWPNYGDFIGAKGLRIYKLNIRFSF